jgi:NAD dependent epimerase/dehydratase
MSNYWKGKKILITGADGFIGSHLTEQLVKKEADVRAFVCYNSFDSWGWIDDFDKEIKEHIDVFPGDIRDPGRVMDAVKGREVVFHLASLIAIPYSYYAPDSYVQTNVYGAVNILNACRKHGVEKVVHTSTSEVYGSAQYVPIDEKHPLQGQSPYAASKIGADMFARSFFLSYGLPVVTVRPFNTYGPRQSLRAVIPTIMTQLLTGYQEIKLGALHPTRDFNFVLDTVSGFLALARCDSAIGNVVNVGSGREISIGDLVALLFEITGIDGKIVCENGRLRPEKSEVDRLLCDASLAFELCGWHPDYTLEQGLAETVRWMKDHLKRFKSKRYTL